jgi:serine/threonine protein phosphatase PrpC
VFKPFTIWSEKVVDCGEDAEPVVILSEDQAFGMAAVFDGLGGSGAGRFEVSGRTYTGARLAAQLARKTLINTVSRIWHTPVPDDDYRLRWNLSERVPTQQLGTEPDLSVMAATELKALTNDAIGVPSLSSPSAHPRLDAYGACFEFTNVPNPSLSAFDGATFNRSFDSSFAATIRDLTGQASSSRVKSRAKRHLPTTIAGAFFSQHQGKASIKIMWAGDSRVYFLCNRGLCQLSIDHAQVAANDTIHSGGDAPLTRVISENTPNEIDVYCQPDILEPGFLIACTDGAYGYFATAVHFELALWSALENEKPDEQAMALAKSIAQVTQDDASLAIIPIGKVDSGGFSPHKRKSELANKSLEFEESISLLRECKRKLAQCETNIETMRESMRPLARTEL